MDKKEFETAKIMYDKRSYAQTHQEAVKQFRDGNQLSAGLYLGLIGAPSRTTHGVAWTEIVMSARMLKLEIPDFLKQRKGVEASKIWAKSLRRGFANSWEQWEEKRSQKH